MDNRKHLVEKIIEELSSREGFEEWWDDITEDTQGEITNSLVNILPIEVVVKKLFCNCKHKRGEFEIITKKCRKCRLKINQ